MINSKFHHVSDPSIVYTAIENSKGILTLTWNGGSTTYYTVREYKKYTKEGTWLVIEDKNSLPIGTKIKLTNQISASIVNLSTVSIETKMSVGGGGGRNIIVWSLLASKQGYKNIIIKALSADGAALESLAKAVIYANEMLSHLGVNVTIETN